MSENNPAHKRRWGRYVKISLVAGISLVVGAVAAVLMLVRTQPTHWKEHQAFLQGTPPEQVQAMAKDVDQKILALTQGLTAAGGDSAAVSSRVLGSESGSGYRPAGAMPVTQATDPALPAEPVIRTIHLSPGEVNAWITERFHEWMAFRDYQVPKGVEDPMVAIDDDRLLMSFAFRSQGFEQIFTAGFDVQFNPDDKAVLQLRDVMAGNLSVPADGIGAYLRSKGPDSDQVRKVADWLDKLHKVEFKPSMKIGDRHKAVVLGYQVNKEGLDLKVRVEERESYGPRQTPQIASVPTESAE